jgi:hypothetical protein
MVTGFWDSFETSYMIFRSLKYSYVDKESTLEANQCGSGSETMLLSLQICGFAIFGLGHQANLRICDLRINHYKFADLRLANWHTSEICGFVIGAK